MKVRNGFVSNSSSSSFIISVPSSVGKGGKIMVEVDPSKVFDTVITSKEELDKWVVDQYGWGGVTDVEKILADEDWVQERYAEMLKTVERGDVVLQGDFEYDDTSVVNLLTSAKGVKTIVDGDY